MLEWKRSYESGQDPPHICRAPHKRVNLGIVGTTHHLSERLADARTLRHTVPAEADANENVGAHPPHEWLLVAREAEHALDTWVCNPGR